MFFTYIYIYLFLFSLPVFFTTCILCLMDGRKESLDNRHWNESHGNNPMGSEAVVGENETRSVRPRSRGFSIRLASYLTCSSIIVTHTQHTQNVRWHGEVSVSFSLSRTYKSLARIVWHVLGGEPHPLSQQVTEQWNPSQTVGLASLAHTRTDKHTQCGCICSER